MSFFNTHVAQINTHIKNALAHLQNNMMDDANTEITNAYEMVIAHNTMIDQNRADVLSNLLATSLIESNKEQKIQILNEAITYTVPFTYSKYTAGKRSKRSKRTKRTRRSKRTRRTRKN